MLIVSSYPLWYFILYIVQFDGTNQAECIKTHRGVYSRSPVCGYRGIPAVIPVHPQNTTSRNKESTYGLSSYPTGITTVPSTHVYGIPSVISQTYRKLKQILLDKINLIIENRNKALASNHPLRHPRWKITLHSKSGFLGLSYETEEFMIDFKEDGTLQTSTGYKGNWWSEYGDIVWRIYSDSNEEVSTYFNAQFCWNYFGGSAFMRRGVVYQDRPGKSWLPRYLFRPVIGKFTAYGIE